MNKPLKCREQEGVIRYLTQCYRKSCQRLKLHRFLTPEKKQEHKDQQQCDELTVALYESALEAMPETYREIIVREFLDESADGWFYNYYAKSTFYRLRQRAIHEFMDCLNV